MVLWTSLRSYVRPLVLSSVLLQLCVRIQANPLPRSSCDTGIEQLKLDSSNFCPSLPTSVSRQDKDPSHLLSECNSAQQQALYHGCGMHALSENQLISAIAYLQESLRLRNGSTSSGPESTLVQTYGHLGQAYYRIQAYAAAEQMYLQALTRFPESQVCWLALARVQVQAQKLDLATNSYLEVLTLNPTHLDALWELGFLEYEQRHWPEALTWFETLTQILPENRNMNVQLGRAVCYHEMGYLNVAEELYHSISIRDNDLDMDRTIALNLGALAQLRGDCPLAMTYYHHVLDTSPDHLQALNNLGACLLALFDFQEGVKVLTRVLTLAPESSPHAYINLARHWMEEGKMEMAKALFAKAYSLSRGTHDGLRIRQALLLPPILPASSHDIQACRNQLDKDLDVLLADKTLQVRNPLEEIERPAFYLVYHGGKDDLAFQQKIAQLELQAAPSVAYLAPELGLLGSKEKQRIGFVSKFFVPDHPHGMLLQGILEHLDRKLFQVVVFAIPNPGHDSLAPEIVKHADEIHVLSLHLHEAQVRIAHSAVQVLIYSDLMSEPLSHYLAYARLAPVQVCFWGNPITSGNPMIDYFISSTDLEDLELAHNHYSEQLVLLEGMGIYYKAFPLPTPGNIQQFRNTGRLHYGFKLQDLLYLCAQSLFKLHPEFDNVLIELLVKMPKAQLILLQGRRKQWTIDFQRRLFLKIDGNTKCHDCLDRIHFVPRVPGQAAYLKLLSIADVILHPFPFGGSKTSSDALALGLPVVTLVNQALRGRMAYALAKRMNVLDCVTYSRAEYLEVSIALGTTPALRQMVQRKLLDRRHLMFQDEQTAQEWQTFLFYVTESSQV